MVAGTVWYATGYSYSLYTAAEHSILRPPIEAPPAAKAISPRKQNGLLTPAGQPTANGAEGPSNAHTKGSSLLMFLGACATLAAAAGRLCVPRTVHHPPRPGTSWCGEHLYLQNAPPLNVGTFEEYCNLVYEGRLPSAWGPSSLALTE